MAVWNTYICMLGVNLADHFIINIPKTKYIFEILGGGGAFPIIMYEY